MIFIVLFFHLDSVGSASTSKVAAHPPAMVMVKEAVKELDSRKGVSSQAIRNSIKLKYPTIDLVRLKYTVRNALIKGLENGSLVRPANSTATGAQGRFRVGLCVSYVGLKWPSVHKMCFQRLPMISVSVCADCAII